LRAAAIFRMSRMSRTSIVKAVLRKGTADAEAIVVETVAVAEDVRVAAVEGVVVAVADAAVEGMAVVAMGATADMAEGDTKPISDC